MIKITTPESLICCKNCGNLFTGKFCNNCGQKFNKQRVTFKLLIYDLFHAVTHFDKGFLFSIKELLIRPGHTVRDYLSGKRSGHANPFLMLLIIGGICSLLYMKLNLRMLNSFNVNDLPEQIHILSSKSFALTMIVYSLLLALIDLIIFKYKGYNYAELFILNTFIAVEILVFEITLIPFWLLGKGTGFNSYFRIFIGFVLVAYIIWVRYQFFEASADTKAKKGLFLELFLFIAFAILVMQKTIWEIFQS